MSIRIRQAKTEDAPALLQIYQYYVEETAISFETETPSPDVFAGRMEKIMSDGFPYLVLETESGIAGYAYAGKFIARAAYNHCCELTIYLDREVRHRGLGSLMYNALMEQLKNQGITNFYACIAVPHTEDDPYLTHVSEQFHHKLGFSICGRFTACGKKFGRVYDMIWCGIEMMV